MSFFALFNLRKLLYIIWMDKDILYIEGFEYKRDASNSRELVGIIGSIRDVLERTE